MVETPQRDATAPRAVARRGAPPQGLPSPGAGRDVVIALLVVLNLGIVLLDNADTARRVSPLPATVESVSPGPASIAGPVDTITVDLDDSLTGVLLIKIDGS